MNPPFPHFARRAALALKPVCFALPLLVAGCSWIPFTQRIVYRVDIQQGTVITQEMAAQLHAGMTREQVRFVLGTPALIDPFHANRWEYTYRMQPGRSDPIERRFTVFFDADKMSRFEGDPLPTEQEFIADRVRFNYEQMKDLGLSALPPSSPEPAAAPTAVPTSAVPGSGPDAGPAPASPASNSDATGSPASVSPAALPPKGEPDTGPGTAAEPSQPASPSIIDRLRNLFNSSPDTSSKSTAPTSPQGPGS
jgi:outer membrane protein assembly factor BamE